MWLCSCCLLVAYAFGFLEALVDALTALHDALVHPWLLGRIAQIVKRRWRVVDVARVGKPVLLDAFGCSFQSARLARLWLCWNDGLCQS